MRVQNRYFSLGIDAPQPRIDTDELGQVPPDQRLAGGDQAMLSAELQQWMAMVQSQPAVRPDALTHAETKWHSGELLGESAAAQVAEAMLQSRE